MTGLLLFAAARFLVSVLALSVTADAAPPLPKGEAKGFPAGKRLSLWESWTRSGLRGQAAFIFFNKESKTSGKLFLFARGFPR